MKDLLKVETQKLAVSSATFLQEKHDNADADVVDCPTRLTFDILICQVCSMTNTGEKYERTQPGNMLVLTMTTVVVKMLTMTNWEV